jgi:hypothetical protein
MIILFFNKLNGRQQQQFKYVQHPHQQDFGRIGIFPQLNEQRPE